jgi:hypothetical protein
VGGAETIFLANDSARPSRTYRVLDKDETAKTLTLDGNPIFTGGTSDWQIPAGVGGVFAPLSENLGPKEVLWPKKTGSLIPAGFDHYDGLMFVIDNGRVVANHRWTSFTSRKEFGQKTEDKLGSNRRSIRGNHRYEVFSLTSTSGDDKGGPYRNYCFRINDRLNDNVFSARNYFDANVPEGGQQHIRLHYGEVNSSTGTGSAGCNVSPEFYLCRKSLIEIYQRRRAAFLGTPDARDAEVDKLLDTVPKNNSALQRRSFGPLKAGQERTPPILLEAGWQNKIFCFYWLIRPDERPVT